MGFTQTQVIMHQTQNRQPFFFKKMYPNLHFLVLQLLVSKIEMIHFLP